MADPAAEPPGSDGRDDNAVAPTRGSHPMTDSPADAVHPYRPAARFIGATAGVLVAMTALWFAWAAVARHRMARALADRPAVAVDPSAAGDPAAWPAALAAVSTTVDCPSNSADVYDDAPPFPPAWWAAAAASERANASALRLARAAANGVPAAVSSTGMNASRALANVLADSAVRAHFDPDHPDDDLCLDRLGDVFALTDAVDRSPGYISRLVAWGIRNLAVERLLVVAPDLNVGSPASPRRRRVEGVIARLLVAPPPLDRGRSQRDETTSILANLSTAAEVNPGLAPLAHLTAVRAVRFEAVVTAAAAQPDAVATSAAMDADPTGWASLARVGRPDLVRLSWLYDYDMAGQPGRLLRVAWVSEADRRAAAVALAVRAYRSDHGRWPATLADAMDAVPRDPLAAGGPPVGYVVRSTPQGDRPLLFLGRRDFDPTTAALPLTPSFEVNGNSGAETTMWFDLSRWPQPSATGVRPGSPQAVDDQPHQPDAGRK